MADRINVTVSEDSKTARIVVGDPRGLRREIGVDLSDAWSIFAGLSEALAVGDQTLLAQLAQLAQRVEALEKLTKGDKAAGAAS
jgi:hypothetical protein